MEKDKIKSLLSQDATARLLRTFKSSRLIKEWRSSFDIDISGELRGIDEISLYRCEASGLEFFLPASAAGGPRLYHDLQKFDWFYMPEKWEFGLALRDIAGSERVLEVGCGQGFFIEKALKGHKGVIKGIELSDEAVRKAGEKKLPVEKADLQELIERGEKFDAVCSFHVLEHVSSPRSFIEAMVKVLAPGGLLIVCVPNRDSFIRLTYNLLDMPPHHMTRWNLKTFKYLEKIFPLKLESAEYEPLPDYHINWYVSVLRGRLPGASLILSDKMVGRVSSLMGRFGLNRFLTGQGIYVKFEKI